MSETANCLAWQKIFNDYNTLENFKEKNYYIITSKKINNYRETRLMTKFDHYNNLPEPLKNNIVKYHLTKNGLSLFDLNINKRNLEFTKLILSKKAFYETFKIYLENQEMPTKKEIVEIIKKSGLYNINKDSTFERRASTIKGWINWIMDLVR